MAEIELYHHGVKGMRWGVRRYQNKNGGLTKAGKRKRFNDERDSAIYDYRAKKKNIKDDYKTSKSEYKSQMKSAKRELHDRHVSNLKETDYYKKAQAHEAKTAARDKARQEKVSNAIKKLSNHKINSEKVTKAMNIGTAVAAGILISSGLRKLSKDLPYARELIKYKKAGL